MGYVIRKDILVSKPFFFFSYCWMKGLFHLYSLLIRQRKKGATINRGSFALELEEKVANQRTGVNIRKRGNKRARLFVKVSNQGGGTKWNEGMLVSER